MTALPLFTFAVIADTHVNPADGQSGSPWPSNALANARARWAVACLNADAPDFVIHLGDMVHPIPQQPDYAAAVARFRSIFADLKPPLHLIPGNHDIGDKPANWMPAHPVSEKSVAIYHLQFGPLWSAFDHGDCRFILHANPLLGSGLAEDEAQWEWLERELKANAGRRIFFCTHYPLFLANAQEPEHYDNLAPAFRNRLQDLLTEAGVETVFSAHVHTIFHTPLGQEGAPPFQHVVPTLSAMRLDYSHLFKAPPPDEEEHGRNDRAKLGYYLVDVYPDRYRLRYRRSHGEGLREGEAPETPSELPRHEISQRPVGVDLRQGWADLRSIPYSGVVDEFSRKNVYNDYLIAALQEAGIRDLRVPLADFLHGPTRQRMRVLAAMGHRFHLFTVAPPEQVALALLQKAQGLVTRLEVIARRDTLGALVSQWRAALKATDIDLLASRMWTSADAPQYGSAFSHAIGHGFGEDETAEAGAIVARGADGAVIRLGPQIDPAPAIRSIDWSSLGKSVIYLSLSTTSPAERQDDDGKTAQRVISALDAMQGIGGVTLICDTLEDLDRGYYPRNGLYDIRFNPRDAALALSKYCHRGSY